MKVAGALTLLVWLVLVVVLCLVPVRHDIVEALPSAVCKVPLDAVVTTKPEPFAGPSTGIEYNVTTACRRRSGLRLAVASLVAGGGAAGGLVLLRCVPRVRSGVNAQHLAR